MYYQIGIKLKINEYSSSIVCFICKCHEEKDLMLYLKPTKFDFERKKHLKYTVQCMYFWIRKNYV
jgi:hypothetical protein